VLVSRAMRLMGRLLERVPLCRAHAIHAEEHGFALLAIEADAPGGPELGTLRPERFASAFAVLKRSAHTGH